MKFTVVWDEDADAELAAIWLVARDRQRLTEVTARIEELLGRFPDDAGESREMRRRVLFDGPLGLLFEIDDANRTVRVLSVWRPHRR